MCGRAAARRRIPAHIARKAPQTARSELQGGQTCNFPAGKFHFAAGKGIALVLQVLYLFNCQAGLLGRTLAQKVSDHTRPPWQGRLSLAGGHDHGNMPPPLLPRAVRHHTLPPKKPESGPKPKRPPRVGERSRSGLAVPSGETGNGWFQLQVAQKWRRNITKSTNRRFCRISP